MGSEHRKTTRRLRLLATAASSALVASTLMTIPSSADENPDSGEFQSVRVAMGGDGVFFNYRIPAIIQLENGDLLASYDGRPTAQDAPGPNSILQRRSTDGGLTWGETTTIHAGQEGANKIGYSDPSYVYDRETGTIFNFHVFSKDQGFWGSQYGNDDEDRNVMSASVSVSTDNGATWEHRSLTTVVKPENVRGTFATSGHGIQITRGEYAGRLVQQYVGEFRDDGVKAYSVYSDDHGETWQMGEPVGVLMDENKVVELSDGTLMMNSRAHNTHTARWVAYSEDGGETWSEPVLDHTLLDPRNNASIIQKNPGAEAGSREAKELLFSNSNAATRTNGSVRYSCDDGETWPVVKTYQNGEHSYSDLVALDDGTYGVIFEGVGNDIRYGTFDDDWLKPFCASFDGGTAEGSAGETVDLTVTITNDDSVSLPEGTVTGSFTTLATAEEVPHPALAPGESAEVTVPVRIATWAQGDSIIRGELQLSSGEYSLRADAVITVTEGSEPVLGPEIRGFHGDPGRDIVTNPYVEGELLPYHFRVDSTSNITQSTYPIAGDFYPFVPDDGAGNCRYRVLSSGTGYDCTTPKHTVNADDVANGFFLPTHSWELTGDGLDPVTIDRVDPIVEIRERLPELRLSVAVTGIEDADGNRVDSVGDIVHYDTTITNSGNVRLTNITGVTEADVLESSEELTVSGNYTLTKEDIAREQAEISGLTASAINANLDVAAEAPAVTIDLDTALPALPTGSVFFVSNSWTSTHHDTVFSFGKPGDEVFAGDWDGNGTDTLGVRRGTTFFVNNELTGGNATTSFNYGRKGDEVLVGDWNGDGKDTFAVRRGTTFFVNNELTGGNATTKYNYGRIGDEAFAGDFDGDGTDTVSLRRGNIFHINNALRGGHAHTTIGYGRSTDTILIGDWNGDGTDTPTVNRIR